MAESSNKHSIEDVLSSIRRLVSDEGASAAKPRPSSNLADKLVLTPQFRVTEPEDPYQTIRALTQTEAQASLPDEPSLEDAPDADVLMPVFVTEQRTRSPFGAQPAETDAPDVTENMDEPSADALEGTAPVESDTDDTAATGAGRSAVIPEDMPLENGEDESDTTALEEGKVEGTEPAIVQDDAISDTMPAYHAAPEPLILDEAAMDKPFETTEPVAETLPAPQAPDTGPSAPLDAPDATVPVEEPSEAEAFREDNDAPAPVTSQAIPFPHDKITREAEADTLSAAAQADDVLDEETLREIIAEVVREEFAGQLGERITRNVRKLVRREIRQMLASEDLE